MCYTHGDIGPQNRRDYPHLHQDPCCTVRRFELSTNIRTITRKIKRMDNFLENYVSVKSVGFNEMKNDWTDCAITPVVQTIARVVS